MYRVVAFKGSKRIVVEEFIDRELAMAIKRDYEINGEYRIIVERI